MVSFSVSLFDFFSYALPGLFVLMALVVGLNPQVANLSGIATILQDINVVLGVAIVIVGYALGFAIDTPGSWLYYRISLRFWGNVRETYRDHIPDSDKRILVRHFSPENEYYLQVWKVAKTMSHNLAFAFIIIALCCLLKLIQIGRYSWAEWILLAVLSAIASLVFLKRSHVFDEWHYRDLSDMYRILHQRTLIPNDTSAQTQKSFSQGNPTQASFKQ